MPTQKRKKIAIFTSLEGHLSIAQSIQSTLEKGYDIAVLCERPGFTEYYLLMYKFFPVASKIPFYLAQDQTIQKIARQYFLKQFFPKVESFLEEFQPDLCINVHYMFTPALEKLTTDKHLPFINIVTDPRSINPFLLSDKAYSNLVFDQQAKEVCCDKVTHPKTDVTGWFVRPQFEETYDKTEMKKKLRLKQRMPIFLITSGSAGTNFILSLLPNLIKVPQPVQLIVACGDNSYLYKTVKVFSQMLKKMKSKCEVTPLRFTPKLDCYIKAADLVIGKAGPNTIFEAVAAHIPFLATTHIAGHEDGNLEIIREYNIGYVEENPFKATSLLKKILSHPEELQKFQKPLKKLATYNRDAKEKLRTLVHRTLAA